MSAARWSVRRFAALDMYGAAGTQRRRRIVLTEFIIGTARLGLIGVWVLMHNGRIWGVWLLGCALNYGFLALHAVRLYPRGKLEADLEGVDVRSEIGRYSVAQLLLFLPGLIATAAVMELL
jgi:hypothetical protein